ITGTVTSSSGPVESAAVRVRNLSGTNLNLAYTNETGQYTLERIPTGYYKVYVRPPSEEHGAEFYLDKPSFDDADPIYVEAGFTTPGIHFQLEEGGRITGRVTDSQLNPIQGVRVRAYDSTQTVQILLREAYTDEYGDYSIGRLPDGYVKIRFDPPANTNYSRKWYYDKRYFREADLVLTEAGKTTTGKDVQLDEGGAIIGQVTNLDGDGLYNIQVMFVDTESGIWYSATTGWDGNYGIYNIPLGDYKVRFRANYGNYVTEWHNNQYSYADAEPVSVASGQNTTGITELSDNGGYITGTVTANGQGVEGVRVQALDSTVNYTISWAFTDSNGFYSIPRLPDCDAKIFFNTNFNNLDYASEWYIDKDSYELAFPLVSVTPEGITPGIDADLTLKALLTITTTELPEGTGGTPYSATLEASGGIWNYNWSLAPDSDPLPDGLSLHGNGMIDGTPTQAGSFPFTVRVVDYSYPPRSDTQNLSITINPSAGVGHTVSGKVYYSVFPLEGVTVDLVEGTDATNPQLQRTTTLGGDGIGSYSFESVAPGIYNVKIYKPVGNPEYIEWIANSIEVVDSGVTQNMYLPKKMTLSTPSNSATVDILRPTLTWIDYPPEVSGGHYTVQLNVTTPWTLIGQWDTPSNYYTVQTDLTQGTNYTWQVDAYDSNNHHVGTTEAAFNFTVNISGGDYPTGPDVSFSSQFYIQTLYIHDMDSDGSNDVLIGGYEYNPNYGGFEIHLQSPAGTYSSTPDIHQHTTTQTTWGPTTGADAGDFDSNGDMDVAGGGYSGIGPRGWVYVYEQTEGLSFTYSQGLETSNPQLAEAADFNNDGLMDISIAEPVSGVIRIWLQKSNGGFSTTSDYGIWPWSSWPYYYIQEYTVADLNNDGLLDVLMSYEERIADPSSESFIYVAFTTAIFYQPDTGWPSGSPITQTDPDVILLRDTISSETWNLGINAMGIGIGDLNNDGLDDVTVLTNSNYPGGASLLIFLNNGTGIPTTPSQTIGCSGSGLAHHFDDMNQDGMDDILVGNPVRAYLQTNSHTIPTTPDFTTTTNAYHLAIADMNSDGDNDIIAGSYKNVYIWFDAAIVETINPIISGQVTLSGGGLAGVTISFSGGQGATTTSIDGTYSHPVSYNWSGTVTPTLAGYTFTPSSIPYSNVTADQENQNYTPTIPTYTISGTVSVGGGGHEGVVMSGLPANPSTNASGYYEDTVNHGWSGTVTPVKAGYTFSPSSTTYTNINANQITNYTTLSYVVLGGPGTVEVNTISTALVIYSQDSL
ncbi:MAG: carboxypeptidase regulatory-like domain-containing protein, partial [Nitrosomonadaceae bacterium]